MRNPPIFSNVILRYLTIKKRDTPVSVQHPCCDKEMSVQGFSVEYIKYQRIFLHPIAKQGFLPPNNCEVFAKNLPHIVSDEEIINFFKQIGDIFKIRIMMDDQLIENRGFCYVTYMKPDVAKEAVSSLNYLRLGDNFVFVEPSLNNCRIFMGGIPTDKSKDKVWQELLKYGIKDIVDVIMYRSYTDRSENRGFVFVEFKTHEHAAHFRAKYSGKLNLWGNHIIIDWSVPIPNVDTKVLEKVKIIFLRNLPVTQIREELENIILRFVNKDTLQKVYKFKNYAFIHLKTRELAENLMDALKVYYKDSAVEVEWAKPASKWTLPDFRQSKVNLTRSRSRNTSSSSTLSAQDQSVTSDSTSPTLIKFSPSYESRQERKLIEMSQSPEPKLSSRASSSFLIENNQERNLILDYQPQPTYREFVSGNSISSCNELSSTPFKTLRYEELRNPVCSSMKNLQTPNAFWFEESNAASSRILTPTPIGSPRTITKVQSNKNLFETKQFLPNQNMYFSRSLSPNSNVFDINVRSTDFGYFSGPWSPDNLYEYQRLMNNHYGAGNIERPGTSAQNLSLNKDESTQLYDWLSTCKRCKDDVMFNEPKFLKTL